MYPIYVVSKGRAQTAATPGLLDRSGLSYSLVVESQEYEDYQQAFPGIPLLVLPASHKGIAYVRSWVLAYAAKQGQSWHWMLDDDVQGFWKVQDGQNVLTDASILSAVEASTHLENVGLIGLCKRSRAGVVSPQPYSLNDDCYTVVCSNAQKLYGKVSYCQDLKIFSDTDFTLQVLSAGYRTVVWWHYAIYTPPVGTKKGGLYETYRKREEMMQWAKLVQARWGEDIIHITKTSSGLVRISPQWKKLQRKLYASGLYSQ